MEANYGERASKGVFVHISDRKRGIMELKTYKFEIQVVETCPVDNTTIFDAVKETVFNICSKDPNMASGQMAFTVSSKQL